MTEKSIYLAGGCFWGVEKFVNLIPGVISTQVGYANGSTAKPTYDAVCSQTTGHAETVEVVYDADRLALDDLLFLFFEVIDPTAVNRQGNDLGTQYRSGVYWTDPADRPAVETALSELGQRIGQPPAVEIGPLKRFWPAEDYHQHYLDHHPNSYCHIPRHRFQQVEERAARVRQLRHLTTERPDATCPPATKRLFPLAA